MNALKRNFALKELLSSAEKGSVHGSLPSLPSLIVEERDWLAALALAPPPCSQREAGMAAYDVVSSPLPMHLIPCLIQPLPLLLISFYCDKRIWLPPTLSKAAKSIRQVIISSLEQRSLPSASWLSHFDNLIQEKIIRKEIEAILSHYSLISVPMVGCNSCVVDDDNDEQRLDFFTLRNSGVNIRKSMKVTGFRALISGSLRSGQQHLASCLLHGFMGHVEIQKVNLATISQEGHWDLLRGLTLTLSKCLNLRRCVIYMPRIDLWAINENLEEDSDASDTASMACKPLTSIIGTKSVSEIWNSSVELVDSVCASASLIILATCELRNQGLPLGIKKFFASNLLDADSALPEHTIPRFCVRLNGRLHHELVINSFAAKLSDDLVRNFVQLLHNRSHPSRSEDKRNKSNAFGLNSEAQTQSIKSLKAIGLEQGMNSSQPSMNSSSLPRLLPSKGTVGASTSAIATFGYQILRYPQFAELCWVTSKPSPCTDINGPWKGWPFNSCGTTVSSSPDKVSKDSSGVVRGLTAAGLLSYRGVYSSVREVSIEVRKVLEILAGHIRAKLLARKDRYQYL